MNIISKKGDIESAPKAYARISFTEKPTDATRVLRENGIETIEVGAGSSRELNRRKFIILCRSIIRTAELIRRRNRPSARPHTGTVQKSESVYA